MGHRPITREVLGDMLYDDFEPFSGLPSKLQSVYLELEWNTLVLNCDCGGIAVQADAENGTLFWNDGPRSYKGTNLTESVPWADCIGLQFDYAWMMNQKCFIDGALLSFGKHMPAVALNVVGSEIKVSTLGMWQGILGA